MALEGKGWYIWQIRRCEGGNAAQIAAEAVASGLSHVLIKVADGTSAYNLDPITGADLVPSIIQALRAKNIQCWGWQYVYGYDPAGEGAIAVQRTQQLNLDGFVIDAEDQYKLPGREAAARTYMNVLRASLPNLPIALSSYRYPTLHPQLPWVAFLEKCDYNMPQVYWVNAHNPGEQLIRSVREFQAITPFRRIIPTGSAYLQGNWQATSADIIDFMQTAQIVNLSAANFWEWGHTKLYVPGLWETVKAFPWGGFPPGGEILDNYFDALNAHNAGLAASLYASNAVHVNGDRVIQGNEAIRNWYQTLFGQILPNAQFTLTGSSGDQSARSFQWTAVSDAGRVIDGSDNFGIVNGAIVYHYTFFTLSPP